MGDPNQLAYVERHRPLFHGPFLEVGSRDYGSTQDLRALFPGADYVGVDMQAGPGVDVALDLTDPFDRIDQALGGRRFGTVFCLSVLEHCRNPFVMGDHITRLLAGGGVVYVSAPFVWKRHAYPDDYWRVTPEGVRLLFADLEFDRTYDMISTGRIGDLRPTGDDLGRVTMSVSRSLRERRYGRAMTTVFLKGLRNVRLAGWLLRHPYLFPPVLLHLIGEKPPPAPT